MGDLCLPVEISDYHTIGAFIESIRRVKGPVEYKVSSFEDGPNWWGLVYTGCD